jgi:hypothetical protein
MFGEPLFSASHHARAGGAQVFSELVPTFRLLSFAIGAYITAAYWSLGETLRPCPRLCPQRLCLDIVGQGRYPLGDKRNSYANADNTQ